VARNALIGLVRLVSRDAAAEDSGGASGGMEAAGRRGTPGGHGRPGGRPGPWAKPSSVSDCSRGMPGGTRVQLEAEIDEGSWYVIRAEAPDPISADPEGLWRRVLRRQGGALAVVSGFPEDPAFN
jgi:hypothetical protein